MKALLILWVVTLMLFLAVMANDVNNKKEKEGLCSMPIEGEEEAECNTTEASEEEGEIDEEQDEQEKKEHELENLYKTLIYERNYTYSIPGAATNPYMKHMFKINEYNKNKKFNKLDFPTKMNQNLFKNFTEFRLGVTDKWNPYVFQFMEKDVRNVIAGVFDLARNVLVDPPDFDLAAKHADENLQSPVYRKKLHDCMYRSPNPDVYEPYRHPFIKALLDVANKKKETRPALSKLYETLMNIPGGEGLERHDPKRYLDTKSYENLLTWAKTISPRKYEERGNNSLRYHLGKWKGAWMKLEQAELVGNDTAFNEADLEIIEAQEKYVSKSPAGPMWKYGGGNYQSNWEMDNFPRYMEFTPDILESLEWLLNNFAAPFTNTGKFYYPPGGFREWHTNVYSGGTGWRAYVVRRPENSKGKISGTKVLHPSTGEILHIDDHDDMHINIFRINDIRVPNWHCVYSKDAHRYSLGMKLTDEDVYRLLVHTGNAQPDSILDASEEKWHEKYDKQLKRLMQNELNQKVNHQLRIRKNNFQTSQFGTLVDELKVKLSDAILNITNTTATPGGQFNVTELVYNKLVINETIVNATVVDNQDLDYVESKKNILADGQNETKSTFDFIVEQLGQHIVSRWKTAKEHVKVIKHDEIQAK